MTIDVIEEPAAEAPELPALRVALSFPLRVAKTFARRLAELKQAVAGLGTADGGADHPVARRMRLKAFAQGCLSRVALRFIVGRSLADFLQEATEADEQYLSVRSVLDYWQSKAVATVTAGLQTNARAGKCIAWLFAGLLCVLPLVALICWSLVQGG